MFWKVIGILIVIGLIIWGFMKIAGVVFGWIYPIYLHFFDDKTSNVPDILTVVITLIGIIVIILIIYKIIESINHKISQKQKRRKEEQKRHEEQKQLEREKLREAERKREEEIKHEEEIRKRKEFEEECKKIGVDPKVAIRCKKCNTVTENDELCDTCFRKELIVVNKGRASPPDENFSYLNKYQYKIFPLPAHAPDKEQISLPFVADIKMTLWIDEEDGFSMLCKEHLPIYENPKTGEKDQYTANALYNKGIKPDIGYTIGEHECIDIPTETPEEYIGTQIISTKRKRYSASYLFYNEVIKYFVDENDGENLIFAVPTVSLLYVTVESKTRAVEYLSNLAKNEYRKAEDTWPITDKLLRYNTKTEKFEIYSFKQQTGPVSHVTPEIPASPVSHETPEIPASPEETFTIKMTTKKLPD